jgi:hypothetical protein
VQLSVAEEVVVILEMCLPMSSQESDHGNDGSLIAAKHPSAVEDLPVETPEEIAKKFNGTCSMLSAKSAAFTYWQAGGLILGLFSLGIFMLSQSTRILGDWWIR